MTGLRCISPIQAEVIELDLGPWTLDLGPWQG